MADPANITISFNGEQLEVPSGTTIESLLEIVEMQKGVVAVEVNLEVVPREQHGSRLLLVDDKIEAVTLVGGG